MKEELEAIQARLNELGLGNIHVYQCAYDSGEAFRGYITSPSLGGLLACGEKGGGWSPCYPDRPNYPYKGSWFSPDHWSGWNPKGWEEAVLAALDPQRLPDMPGKAHYVNKVSSLRDPLRAATAIAILEGGHV